jgi:hypothetical protein
MSQLTVRFLYLFITKILRTLNKQSYFWTSTEIKSPGSNWIPDLRRERRRSVWNSWNWRINLKALVRERS